MRRIRGVVAALAAAGLVAMAACGRPQAELVPGAESMSDEEKIEKVQDYCAQWVGNIEAALKKKEQQGVVAIFDGVKAHRKGCDIELDRFNNMLFSALASSPMVTIPPTPVGTIRGTFRYNMSSSGDPKDAVCSFSLLCKSGPTSVAHAGQYRPDPRIFAVFLPKKGE